MNEWRTVSFHKHHSNQHHTMTDKSWLKADSPATRSQLRHQSAAWNNRQDHSGVRVSEFELCHCCSSILPEVKISCGHCHWRWYVCSSPHSENRMCHNGMRNPWSQRTKNSRLWSHMMKWFLLFGDYHYVLFTNIKQKCNNQYNCMWFSNGPFKSGH